MINMEERKLFLKTTTFFFLRNGTFLIKKSTFSFSAMKRTNKSSYFSKQ